MLSGGLALLLLLAAPAEAGELPAARADELAHLVVNDCGSCHGLTLAGGLGPDIRPAALAGRSPEALAEVILDGRPGTAMPPWRPLLSEAEAAWIVGYLLEGPP
ncbi:MAG TPA: cytochrome c [Amaricoccus sp.]|jgi:cytochrome c55X|nr:cytochrome c [Amaricoccus sp.]